MENLTYSSSVKRIDSSSQREIEMMREAIRGEFEPGKYVRDIGVGAAAGAAAGAAGGVSALPGAAIGAAWGLGSNAASDIWYQTRSDEDKASWQAGDLQEHLEKMGGLLTGKTQSPQIGERLNQLGMQYKNYIDVIVQKTDNEEQKKIYEQNMFNPNTDDYKYFKSQYPQRTSSFKFKRVVQAADSSPAAMIGGTGASMVADKLVTKPTDIVKTPQSELLRKYWTGTLNNAERLQVADYFEKNPDVYKETLKRFQDPIALAKERAFWEAKPINPGVVGEDIVGEAGKQLTKPGFWKNVGTGAKSLGVGLAVDWVANWGLDKIDMAMTGGEINMFRRELADVGKIITEINRLTKNQEDVVYAGNMLWTGLKEVDRMLAEVENKKSKEPQVSNLNPQANTSGQPTANMSAPNNTGSIMSSNSSKFIRLG